MNACNESDKNDWGKLGGDAEGEEPAGDGEASFGDQDKSGGRNGSVAPGPRDASPTIVLSSSEETFSIEVGLGSVGLSGSDSAESGC